MIVGALVVAALVVVAVFSLSGGDDGPLGAIVGDDTPQTPPFDFDAANPKPVETATTPDHQQALTAAQAPSEAVTQRLDNLYTAAFLDPGNWMEGSYDDMLGLFAEGARDAAETQLDVLTAGPEAAEAFETIRPMPSTLKIQVLFDPAGVPSSVEGSARFVAMGSGTAGQVMLVSKGQFIFERTDGEWLVVAFSVQRNDEEREPKPGGSSSPSTDESVGPSEAGSS